MKVKDVLVIKEAADDLNDGRVFMTGKKLALVIIFGIA
jgi:hypothetical protein